MVRSSTSDIPAPPAPGGLGRTVSFVTFALALAQAAEALWGQGASGSPLASAPGLADLPGRGVARISLVSGDVSLRRGDTEEWVAATTNAPLLGGDQLVCGPASRGEVQFDWANYVRLSANTEVRFPEVERDRYQLQLARGLVTLAMLRDTAADIDFNTPSASIRPLRPGSYRISVAETAEGLVTEISVRTGEAEVLSPQGTRRLRAGRTLLIRGASIDLELRSAAYLSLDDWDRWNMQRDREILRSRAYDYVSRDIFGAEALDPYGDWIFTSRFGYVWAPRVPPGWTPYRLGRWGWLDSYGWTWISYEPWGWAPYHFGRWFWHDNRWCWWAGDPGLRTFWRPALVAWVGWGSFPLGIGFRGPGWSRIGWIPLAPFEPFCPWYGPGWSSSQFPLLAHTRVVNNVNIRRWYQNARLRGGITVVDGLRFGRGPVDAIELEDLDRVDLVQGVVPVPPDLRSTRMVEREARAIGGAETLQFYSRRAVKSPERIPFDLQRRYLEDFVRRSASRHSELTADAGPPAAVDSVPPPSRTERLDRSWQGAPESSVSGFGQAVAEPRAGRLETNRTVGEPGGGYRRLGAAGDGWRRLGEAHDFAPQTADSLIPPFDNSARSQRGAESWRRFDASLGAWPAERGGLRPEREVSPSDQDTRSRRYPDSPFADGSDRYLGLGRRFDWGSVEGRSSVGGGQPVGGRREVFDPRARRDLSPPDPADGRAEVGGERLDSPWRFSVPPSAPRSETGGAGRGSGRERWGGSGSARDDGDSWTYSGRSDRGLAGPDRRYEPSRRDDLFFGRRNRGMEDGPGVVYGSERYGRSRGDGWGYSGAGSPSGERGGRSDGGVRHGGP